jgi:hypothetical protein
MVHGVARQDLPELYSQAAVVYEACMVGTERMPVEATLYGAILFASTRCPVMLINEKARLANPQPQHCRLLQHYRSFGPHFR